MDIELPFDFKEFLKLLNGNGVRYLLIGGYVVGYHGYPRATKLHQIKMARPIYGTSRLLQPRGINDQETRSEGLDFVLFKGSSR